MEPNNNIIIFPDFEKLQDEVERLRTEVSMLLLERDELQFVTCRNIEAAYMLQLGGLEYQAYQLQCAVLRLKRKITLIQIRKNRQEKVILADIEATLDAEFAEYQEQLNQQMERMNEAIAWSKAGALTQEESKELKQKYRAIVKALHPDLHPHLSEVQKTLWQNAVNAYKNGDLATIRIIAEMVGEHVFPTKEQDAMKQLLEEKERLAASLEAIRKDMEKIKSTYPYTVKDLLEDPEKTARRKAELEDIVRQYKEMLAVYEKRLEETLRRE